AGSLYRCWLTRPATARRANPAITPKRMRVPLLPRLGAGFAALGGTAAATGAGAIFGAGFGADTGAEGRTAIRVVSSGGGADDMMAIRVTSSNGAGSRPSNSLSQAAIEAGRSSGRTAIAASTARVKVELNPGHRLDERELLSSPCRRSST